MGFLRAKNDVELRCYRSVVVGKETCKVQRQVEKHPTFFFSFPNLILFFDFKRKGKNKEEMMHAIILELPMVGKGRKVPFGEISRGGW